MWLEYSCKACISRLKQPSTARSGPWDRLQFKGSLHYCATTGICGICRHEKSFLNNCCTESFNTIVLKDENSDFRYPPNVLRRLVIEDPLALHKLGKIELRKSFGGLIAIVGRLPKMGSRPGTFLKTQAGTGGGLRYFVEAEKRLHM